MLGRFIRHVPAIGEVYAQLEDRWVASWHCCSCRWHCHHRRRQVQSWCSATVATLSQDSPLSQAEYRHCHSDSPRQCTSSATVGVTDAATEVVATSGLACPADGVVLCWRQKLLRMMMMIVMMMMMNLMLKMMDDDVGNGKRQRPRRKQNETPEATKQPKRMLRRKIVPAAQDQIKTSRTYGSDTKKAPRNERKCRRVRFRGTPTVRLIRPRRGNDTGY